MVKPASRPADARRLRQALLLAAGVVVAGAAVWAAQGWWRRDSVPPAGAPLTGFTSPFLNARPDVGYVGSARCAGCHRAQASTYAEHPMGRSVSPPDRWLAGQDRAAPSFEASGLSYAVGRTADGAVHKESARGDDGRVRAEVAVPIAFALGSGRQGQSFLVNREGYLFQSPVSWYSRDGTWRLSPGYERINQHFTRYVTQECLFCHADGGRAEPDAMNRYRPGLRLEPIGCERCHGPGALHVAAREGGTDPAGEDLTIVNPDRLAPPLREAVCEQCHLQGEARVVARGRSLFDYRPGLPLQEFVSVYIRPPGEAGARKAVSHVEQMHASRCFRAADGQMGCTTCHDPHALPAAPQRVGWYRSRCLTCHQEASCALPAHERRRQNPADSCVDCHMPRGDGSNIAHSAITDHRIPRHADRPAHSALSRDPSAMDLVAFSPGGASGAGDPRDLGLALVEVAGRPAAEPLRRAVARRARDLLRGAVERAPDDLPALEGLGIALWQDKAPREALATLEQVLERAPRREPALEQAARATMELGDGERSLAYWRRLVEVNPHSAEGRAFLAQALAHRAQWAAAVDECRAALRLDPFEHRARMLLIDCLLRVGDAEGARAEYDTLLACRPPDPDRLRRWFDQRSRPSR